MRIKSAKKNFLTDRTSTSDGRRAGRPFPLNCRPSYSPNHTRRARVQELWAIFTAPRLHPPRTRHQSDPPARRVPWSAVPQARERRFGLRNRLALAEKRESPIHPAHFHRRAGDPHTANKLSRPACCPISPPTTPGTSPSVLLPVEHPEEPMTRKRVARTRPT